MATTVQTSLLIIGGAEDKVGRTTVLRRFFRLAGGSKARIVVIPTASSFPEEAVATYTAIFNQQGPLASLGPALSALIDPEATLPRPGHDLASAKGRPRRPRPATHQCVPARPSAWSPTHGR